ncbi:hypothetical protein [Actinoplanes sp. CA-252034]|uniref:hypothetical protein n=1 Tax=Actinoplanes sp. CA-252034 TaxID=3239906 RepID=UPI003D974627
MILVGVLAVVAVGWVVHEQTTRDEPAPVPPPVALGPVTQVPIPLPSATPTPSMAPVNQIVVEQVPIGDTVDLAAEGRIDWVHWGEEGRYSLERDSGGKFTILEGTPGEPRLRHTDSPQRFTWTGAPAKGVTSGIETCGTGHGFTLSAPAGPGPHTLRLYLGATMARGDLRLELSTGGEAYTDSFTSRKASMGTTAYVVSYRATGTGKISIKWITGATFDENCGGVALQAATLS